HAPTGTSSVSPTFSLHDAPPTHHYTLSLHDALPIFDIQTGNPIDEQTASWIQQGLQKVGIGVSINKQPSAAFTAQLQAKKHAFRSEDTRLNSSHGSISYAVFCLKKKKETIQ